MKKKAVLLWFVYFSNLIIVPRFFLTQAEDGTLHVDRKVYILVQLMTAMYAVWSYREVIQRGFERLVKRRFVRDIAIGYVVRVVLTMLLALVVPLQQTDNQANIESLLNSTSIVLMLILTCVVAPIVEELVFREAIIGAFKDKMNPWILTAISIFFFVLLHSISNSGGIDWGAALMYIPLTIPLVGMYRYYEDNVAASMLMHFVSNSVAMIFLVARGFLS
ncbi:type II CAAX endopeptidase family protein [uncultured Granulicatella sp.]|jgi:CAAX amino protease|uniref:CPBP family intramembrane glutamic endopeptidase n=1 Tax=uncultured Granulicatella sp. TaxID=316089 RepID=UPI0028D8A905|nr:type II CAAX endopeptidase family protein [uncultured Granulicatella sp.]